jgi:hypothetical protein
VARRERAVHSGENGTWSCRLASAGLNVTRGIVELVVLRRRDKPTCAETCVPSPISARPSNSMPSMLSLAAFKHRERERRIGAPGFSTSDTRAWKSS